ncbi:MAG: hypothetical protein PWP72_1687 [Thermoanaerobacter sp.]|nr:hypothetical protein [Thermoanaerobacter sp.]
MNCREARQLLYPWLDGVATEEEARRLQEHLRECSACAGELAGWRAITSALKGLAAEAAPPEGFSTGIITRLRESTAETGAGGLPVPGTAETAAAGGPDATRADGDGTGKRAPGTWWRKLTVTWRRGLAAAAAVVILLAGSASFAARYWWPPEETKGPAMVVDNSGQGEQDRDNSSTAAENRKETVARAPAGAGSQLPEERTPGEDNGQPAAPGGDNGQENVESSGTGEPPSPDPAAAEEGREDRTGQPRKDGSREDMAVAANTGQPEGSRVESRADIVPRVFLNQSRTIESTLLKVEVSDLAAAKNALLAAAGGASYQSFGRQQVEGKTVEILRFVIPVERATHFTATATGLGRVLDRQQQSQDISQQFASTLDRYRALIARHNQTTDKAEAEALEQQIKSLEQQLAAWDREAGQQVVVVWLQE